MPSARTAATGTSTWTDGMCLKVNQDLTRKVVVSLSSSGAKEVTIQKVFVLEDGTRLRPLYQHHADYSKEQGADGWLRASANQSKEDSGYVGAGAYHGYYDPEKSGKAAATCKWVSDVYRSVVVRDVTIPVDSIVGCDAEGSIAFTRMRIQIQEGETV